MAVIDLRDEPYKIAALLANIGKSIGDVMGNPQKDAMALAILQNSTLGQGIAEAYQQQIEQQPSIQGATGEVPILSTSEEMAKRVAMQRAGLTPELVQKANTLYGQSPEVQSRIAARRAGLPQKEVTARAAQLDAAVPMAQAQGVKSQYEMNLFKNLDPVQEAAVRKSGLNLQSEQTKFAIDNLKNYQHMFAGMSDEDKEWATMVLTNPEFVSSKQRQEQLGISRESMKIQERQGDRSLDLRARELDIMQGRIMLEAQYKAWENASDMQKRAAEFFRLRADMSDELRKLMKEAEGGGSEEYLAQVQGRIADLMQMQSAIAPQDYMTTAQVLNGWFSNPKLKISGYRPETQEDPRVAASAQLILEGKGSVRDLIAKEQDPDPSKRITPKMRAAIMEYVQRVQDERGKGFIAGAQDAWYRTVTGQLPNFAGTAVGGGYIPNQSGPMRGIVTPPNLNIPRGLPQNNRELGGR